MGGKTEIEKEEEKNITKTCLFKYTEKFYHKKKKKKKKKNENFLVKKNSDIFLISAENIDCGYSLEPLRCVLVRNASMSSLCFFLAEIRKLMYTPCKPQFYYIKVGFKWVKII